jgi:hypothetical protein
MLLLLDRFVICNYEKLNNLNMPPLCGNMKCRLPLNIHFIQIQLGPRCGGHPTSSQSHCWLDLPITLTTNPSRGGITITTNPSNTTFNTISILHRSHINKIVQQVSDNLDIPHMTRRMQDGISVWYTQCNHIGTSRM